MNFLRSIRRKYLNSKKVSDKFKMFYKMPPFTKNEFIGSLIDENIWIFSQMKSGTTVLTNTLAFYNLQLMGNENYDFDALANSGVSRAIHENLDHINKIAKFKMITNLPWTIQTHNEINAKPEKLIFTTRNAEDFCVSDYYWNFKNRKTSQEVNIDDALKISMDKYVLTHKAQQKAADNCDNVLEVNYERLMLDPFKELKKVIIFLYGTVDETMLHNAIEASSIANLKIFEDKRGYASIARKDSLSVPHFVRSGKVGEGKEFYSSEQLKFISNCLMTNRIGAVV